MQVVRMIVWVLMLTALLVFSFANWDPSVDVRIWPNLVVQTKIPALVVVSILIGFLPTWLLYRASKWQLNRRMGTLAANHRAALQTTATAPEPDTVLTPAEHPAPVTKEPGPPPVP
jgi:putative membrane protein